VAANLNLVLRSWRHAELAQHPARSGWAFCRSLRQYAQDSSTETHHDDFIFAIYFQIKPQPVDLTGWKEPPVEGFTRLRSFLEKSFMLVSGKVQQAGAQFGFKGCREGGVEPPRPEGRRILSPQVGVVPLSKFSTLLLFLTDHKSVNLIRSAWK
jgi:hypothetical protein